MVRPLDGVVPIVDREAAEELEIPKRLEHPAVLEHVGKVDIGCEPIGEPEVHQIAVEGPCVDEFWRHRQHRSMVDNSFQRRHREGIVMLPQPLPVRHQLLLMGPGPFPHQPFHPIREHPDEEIPKGRKLDTRPPPRADGGRKADKPRAE